MSVDGTDEVSVMEGDSVTLHTDVDTNQQDRMTWYFKNIRIAQINGNKSKICTDEECPQRFRDRLTLRDGSLVITNINTTDAGVYQLQIPSRNIEKTFSVTVHGESCNVLKQDCVCLNHSNVFIIAVTFLCNRCAKVLSITCCFKKIAVKVKL